MWMRTLCRLLNIIAQWLTVWVGSAPPPTMDEPSLLGKISEKLKVSWKCNFCHRYIVTHEICWYADDKNKVKAVWNFINPFYLDSCINIKRDFIIFQLDFICWQLTNSHWRGQRTWGWQSVSDDYRSRLCGSCWHESDYSPRWTSDLSCCSVNSPRKRTWFRQFQGL